MSRTLVVESFDTSKYRTLEIYDDIERVLPSIPWHPRAFYADTERKLP